MEDMIYVLCYRYMEAVVCVVSCLMLLVVMVKRYRRFGMDVFVVSGTMSVLSYTCFVGRMWLKYMQPMATLSVMRVALETALVVVNILLLAWFCRLAKINYEPKWHM